MAEKAKGMSADDQKALEEAHATIKRLTGAALVLPTEDGPPVLRRFRVLLHGVTWDEKTGEYYDNTCKSIVKDEKTGLPREVILDRAVVTAYTDMDAYSKFCKAWGIRNSDHTPQFREVRNLTEDERKMATPPKVVEPVPNVLPGVPAPTVLPIHADGMFNRPVSSPMAAITG